MKKIIFVLTLLILIPMSVFAATTPRIITLEANATEGEIKYNGTVEPNSYAVMCKLYNEKDVELDLLSSPVSEEKFDGNFTVTESGNYKIACANYEGGEIKTTEVTVKLTETKEENPKTGDNIVLYMTIAGIAVVGLVVGVLVVKKRK